MNRFSLDGKWRIRGFDGMHGAPEAYLKSDADDTVFFDAEVPGEIHLDLMRAGLIDEVNEARNAQSARWVEEQVWVYRKTFTPPAEALQAQAAWLLFQGLDLYADIYLNGEKIGSHHNAHIPCRINIAGKLVEGENILAVRIESGLYAVSDKPGMPYSRDIDHQLHKRSWLRKPQYEFSWDWNPRLVNVGIWRPVTLEWCSAARLDAAPVHSRVADDNTAATLHCRAQVENVTQEPLDVTVRMTCEDTGTVGERSASIEPGQHHVHVELAVDNPKLWWPRGYGDQPLYTMRIELLVNGECVDTITRRTGIRSIELKHPVHPDGGRYFLLEINGVQIFAKGGNWVPPDMIPARATPERHRQLVELAAEANFNALRIWGGGLYADHAMLDACDELGIIVWHDLLFACSKYPGDDKDFYENVKAEVTFGVRDLAHHPSLVVWCGNNEIEWGDCGWGYDYDKPFPHYGLFHNVFPRIMAAEDPSRPYWPSSPYSLDMEFPNAKHTGDQHPWDVSLGPEIDNIWAYRHDISRFPNEGGVLGASGPATMRQFLPENERRLFSPSWEFHDNAMNYKHPERKFNFRGVCYQAVDNWLGFVPETMPFDDYLYYSALLQCEGLKEYIDNFRRRKFDTSAAIFWMYNDSWPATHGWTIIDYYLRRKLDYHPVRRAFQPVSVVPAITGDEVVIYGVNDTLTDWRGTVRYGLARLAGGLSVDASADVLIGANSSAELARVTMAEWNAAGTKECIAFALLKDANGVVAQNRIFVEPFKNMTWSAADVHVSRDGDQAVFTSQTFAWCVAIDLDGEQPIVDNAFDLLPGIEYRIPWPKEKELPKVLRTGNLV